MLDKISLVWFRQDLRLSDNLALYNACKNKQVMAVYIFDDCAPKPFKIGSASKIWLHHSLAKLDHSLHNKLQIYVGNTVKIISNLAKLYEIEGIYFNTCYEPWHVAQEQNIEHLCKKLTIKFNRYNSNYLFHPSQILKQDSSYYKVFTAYKNKTINFPIRKLVNEHHHQTNFVIDTTRKNTLANLGLIPIAHNWHNKIVEQWHIGEQHAKHKLNKFSTDKVKGYKLGRDYPGKQHTSLLSPHLHFGEISPVQILQHLNSTQNIPSYNTDTNHFINELIWREFSCYLLYHTQTIHQENINTKFNNFPWKNHSLQLTAWRLGKTGYPIIDAGMRELWQTGYMHNRVRMIVASFLVKNLNIHWHKGRDWFWDCLVDADLANNSTSWQWVAGCGVDASPYFRIFNPITQGEKFDGDGLYTKKFIPELKNLPNKYLFRPWEAPQEILQSANIILGTTYPKPIVDITFTRKRALGYLKTI